MSVEFDAHNAVITPEGVFVIGTYDESGKPNAMTAAWGTQSDFGEITIYLSKRQDVRSQRLLMSTLRSSTDSLSYLSASADRGILRRVSS